MKITSLLLGMLCLFFSPLSTSFAQTNTQIIRGTVIDAESKTPLIGANIILMNRADRNGTSTDEYGNFRIIDVPLGRQDISISYLSYESKTLTGILLTSGKELVLEIELQESAVTMDELTITAASSLDKSNSLNPFANVSSRTFSIEETSRYAASVFDPARMAQNYAGVSVASGSDDLFNEIVIRGNTPSGVLWRLEGIEIPNPNHFGDMGNSGGAISMLSSTSLTNSDFYTGAFPAEYGNATSGVFDLKMRNGNNENREYSFMFGALGVELGMEGPISKQSGSSYLVNYRYSTLALLQASGVNPTGEILPTYQDLSFKLNFPNPKLGNISIFGLAGNNLAANNPPLDSLEWEEPGDEKGFEENGDMAVLGITHTKLLKNDAYVKTILSGSFERSKNYSYKIEDDYSETFRGRDRTRQTALRLSMLYHQKLSNKSSGRIGGIVSYKDFAFSLDDNDPLDRTQIIRYFENKSTNTFVQGYGQWKYRANNDLSLFAGVHGSVLTGNSQFSIEPRFSIQWKINKKQKLSLSTGLHSKMEHMALYSFEGSFSDQFEVKKSSDLGLSKSYHNVLGYDYLINPNFRIKMELYYQYLYDIPIHKDDESTYSVLNSFDIYDALDVDELVSDGKGKNIGIDLTVERFLNKGFYLLFTGSVFDSKYKTNTEEWYNTRFNGGYQAHVLLGKEFKFGNKSLGVNAKAIVSGGARYSEIDLEASNAVGYGVAYNNPPYNLQAGQYMRIDWGIKFQVDRKKSTHTFMFDIQNTTNRENPFIIEYDDDSRSLVQDELLGMFPFINYRIEF